MSEATGPAGGGLSEAEGRALLEARFQAAGFSVEVDHRFEQDGLELTLDGFDPRARVGYELITTAAGDRAEFTAEVVARLEEGMAAGRYHLLLVDEAAVGRRTLERAADRFLQRVRAGRAE